jgi:hypothetical protein
MFSSRTAWEVTPNELTRRIEARRQAGLPLLDLTESNPTRCGFSYPEEIIFSSLATPERLVYEPSPKGLIEARAAVADYYQEKGISVSPDQIVLASSTSEAYSFLFRLLANFGEQVLVPKPSYPLFDFLATLNDVTLAGYPLVYDNGWRMDLDGLRAAVKPDTRAIIVVNPNNPTGSFVKRDEQAALVEVCQRHELALICDEVFADYAFVADAAQVTTLAGTRHVLTFTLSGISKLLGLPQMKLAWICASGPGDVLAQALTRLEIISDTYLSVGTPVQRGLMSFMALRPQITTQIRERVAANRQLLTEQIRSSNRGEVLYADAGWYAVLRLPPGQSDEQFVIELLDHEGVLVHPGYFFDFADDRSVVISLLPPPDVFCEGVTKLSLRLEPHGQLPAAESRSKRLTGLP